ncbi:unnamed protein product [Urochloa humidicola]
MEDYIGQQVSHYSYEAGHALAVPFGSPEAKTTLRGFFERVRRGCRRMAWKLNCMASHDEAFVGVASGSDVCSAGRETSVTRSSARTTTTRGRRGGSLTIGPPRVSSATRVRSGSSSRGKQAAVDDFEDDEEEDNESNDLEEADPTYEQDINGSSQLSDAPSPTQPTQGTPQKHHAHRCDHIDGATTMSSKTLQAIHIVRRKLGPLIPPRVEEEPQSEQCA